MEQKANKGQSNTKQPSSKMVSFRMPMAYIDQLQQLAQGLGKSKSQVLRMGLDSLQRTAAHRGAEGIAMGIGADND